LGEDNGQVGRLDDEVVKDTDDASAMAWLQLAAEQDNTEAMWLLGRRYYEGKVANKVPVLSRARYWFSKCKHHDDHDLHLSEFLHEREAPD
jgi:TPR repeat protein